MDTKYCKKCYSFLKINNFHKSKSRSYPDGHISICKDCIKKKHNTESTNKNLFYTDTGLFTLNFF
jgi:RNase P subunit RPR2